MVGGGCVRRKSGDPRAAKQHGHGRRDLPASSTADNCTIEAQKRGIKPLPPSRPDRAKAHGGMPIEETIDHENSFRTSLRAGLQVVKRAKPRQAWPDRGDGDHHQDGTQSPHRPPKEPFRASARDARLELAQFVRRGDEDRVDRGDPPPHLVRSQHLHQRLPHHHADVIKPPVKKSMANER